MFDFGFDQTGVFLYSELFSVKCYNVRNILQKLLCVLGG